MFWFDVMLKNEVKIILDGLYHFMGGKMGFGGERVISPPKNWNNL